MKRILFIDDSTTSQMIVKRMLGEKFDVTAADSPIEGVSLVETSVFDLVLMDYYFPKGTAMDAIVPIRQHHTTSGLPIIAASCSMDSALKARLLKFGVNACTPKPFSREVLLPLVERMLAAPFVESLQSTECAVSAFEWYQGGHYYQYCPELGVTLSDQDPAELSAKMRSAIQDKAGSGTPLGYVAKAEVRTHVIRESGARTYAFDPSI